MAGVIPRQLLPGFEGVWLLSGEFSEQTIRSSAEEILSRPEVECDGLPTPSHLLTILFLPDGCLPSRYCQDKSTEDVVTQWARILSWQLVPIGLMQPGPPPLKLISDLISAAWTFLNIGGGALETRVLILMPTEEDESVRSSCAVVLAALHLLCVLYTIKSKQFSSYIVERRQQHQADCTEAKARETAYGEFLWPEDLRSVLEFVVEGFRVPAKMKAEPPVVQNPTERRKLFVPLGIPSERYTIHRSYVRALSMVNESLRSCLNFDERIIPSLVERKKLTHAETLETVEGIAPLDLSGLIGETCPLKSSLQAMEDASVLLPRVLTIESVLVSGIPLIFGGQDIDEEEPQDVTRSHQPNSSLASHFSSNAILCKPEDLTSMRDADRCNAALTGRHGALFDCALAQYCEVRASGAGTKESSPCTCYEFGRFPLSVELYQTQTPPAVNPIPETARWVEDDRFFVTLPGDLKVPFGRFRLPLLRPVDAPFHALGAAGIQMGSGSLRLAQYTYHLVADSRDLCSAIKKMDRSQINYEFRYIWRKVNPEPVRASPIEAPGHKRRRTRIPSWIKKPKEEPVSPPVEQPRVAKPRPMRNIKLWGDCQLVIRWALPPPSAAGLRDVLDGGKDLRVREADVESAEVPKETAKPSIASHLSKAVRSTLMGPRGCPTDLVKRRSDGILTLDRSAWMSRCSKNSDGCTGGKNWSREWIMLSFNTGMVPQGKDDQNGAVIELNFGLDDLNISPMLRATVNKRLKIRIKLRYEPGKESPGEFDANPLLTFRGDHLVRLGEGRTNEPRLNAPITTFDLSLCRLATEEIDYNERESSELDGMEVDTPAIAPTAQTKTPSKKRIREKESRERVTNFFGLTNQFWNLLGNKQKSTGIQVTERTKKLRKKNAKKLQKRRFQTGRASLGLLPRDPFHRVTISAARDPLTACDLPSSFLRRVDPDKLEEQCRTAQMLLPVSLMDRRGARKLLELHPLAPSLEAATSLRSILPGYDVEEYLLALVMSGNDVWGAEKLLLGLLRQDSFEFLIDDILEDAHSEAFEWNEPSCGEEDEGISKYITVPLRPGLRWLWHGPYEAKCRGPGLGTPPGPPPKWRVTPPWWSTSRGEGKGTPPGPPPPTPEEIENEQGVKSFLPLGKKLFLKPVRDLSGTIFSTFGDNYLRDEGFCHESLTSIFGTDNRTSRSESPRCSAPSTARLKEVTYFEGRVAQNLGILMSRLPPAEVIGVQLENLICLPTSSSVPGDAKRTMWNRVRGVLVDGSARSWLAGLDDGQVANLRRTPEKELRPMAMRFPHDLTLNCEILSLYNVLMDRLGEMAERLIRCMSCATAIRQSVKLKHILALILRWVNFINHGAKDQRSSKTRGFTFESLMRLTEFVSPSDARITLLHFVVAKMRQPPLLKLGLHTLPEELELSAARGTTTDQLNSYKKDLVEMSGILADAEIHVLTKLDQFEHQPLDAVLDELIGIDHSDVLNLILDLEGATDNANHSSLSESDASLSVAFSSTDSESELEVFSDDSNSQTTRLLHAWLSWIKRSGRLVDEALESVKQTEDQVLSTAQFLGVETSMSKQEFTVEDFFGSVAAFLDKVSIVSTQLDSETDTRYHRLMSARIDSNTVERQANRETRTPPKLADKVRATRTPPKLTDKEDKKDKDLVTMPRDCNMVKSHIQTDDGVIQTDDGVIQTDDGVNGYISSRSPHVGKKDDSMSISSPTSYTGGGDRLPSPLLGPSPRPLISRTPGSTPIAEKDDSVSISSPTSLPLDEHKMPRSILGRSRSRSVLEKDDSVLISSPGSPHLKEHKMQRSILGRSPRRSVLEKDDSVSISSPASHPVEEHKMPRPILSRNAPVSANRNLRGMPPKPEIDNIAKPSCKPISAAARRSTRDN